MAKKSILLVFLTFLSLSCWAEVNYLTDAEFKAKIFDHTTQKEWSYKGMTPCVVDFYATWCGPCKRLAPIMDSLSTVYEGKINFFKVDVDKERDLVAAFGIRSIPQVLYIPVTGKPAMQVGFYPPEEIVKNLDALIKKDNFWNLPVRKSDF